MIMQTAWGNVREGSEFSGKELKFANKGVNFVLNSCQRRVFLVYLSILDINQRNSQTVPLFLFIIKYLILCLSLCILVKRPAPC